MLALRAYGWPDPSCEHCEWHVRVSSLGTLCMVHTRLATLATNLSTAAQLCAHAEALTRNVQRWMDGRCALWRPNAEGMGL